LGEVIVVDRESNFYKRIIFEMIHIKEQKTDLNLNSNIELLDAFYFNILNNLNANVLKNTLYKYLPRI